MGPIKNLAEVSKEEQKKYLNSFDTVFFDMDGVIWLKYIAIPGAPECINNLKKLGKGVHFITNNSTTYTEELSKHLKENKFSAELKDIVTPVQTIIAYLKKIEVKGDIYLLSNRPFKEELKKNGFKLVPEPPASIDDTLDGILSQYDGDRKIGAVIIDYDFNVNFIKLQKAYWYLRDNPECAWLISHTERKITVGPNQDILGTYHYIESVAELSGRKYIEAGKPSSILINYITEKYNVTNPGRTLFVGDSIPSDMGTGANAGFQKLLVLSGITKMEHLDNWHYPEEYRPQYYVEDIGVLNDVIKLIFNRDIDLYLSN